jgi:type 1 glutamine amidotransferase
LTSRTSRISIVGASTLTQARTGFARVKNRCYVCRHPIAEASRHFGSAQLAAENQVLILTGRDDHGWRGLTPLMRRYLNEVNIFEVRTTEEFRDTGPNSLAPDDVAVLVYNDQTLGDAVSQKTRKAIEDSVRSGKGLAVHHHTAAAFRDWAEFPSLCGGNCYAGAQHSPLPDFGVEFQDRDHPITRALKKSFEQTHDELYSNMKMQPAGNYHVRATAWDDFSLD